MLRAVPFLALSLVSARALAAQEKPAPAVQQALTGKWLLDQAHSDPIPEDPLAHASGGGTISGGNPSHAPASGGGGGSGSGGGGRPRGGSSPAPTPTPMATTPTTPDAGAPAPSSFSRNRDPHVQLIMANVDPGPGMVIGVNDSVVAIATAAMLKADPNAQSNWKTDGRKRQDAQMDGTIIETQSMWKDGTLTIVYGAAGVASFKREFKAGKDGKTLEVKESVESNGRKADYKLVFTRS